jgi:hypothetical protein
MQSGATQPLPFPGPVVTTELQSEDLHVRSTYVNVSQQTNIMSSRFCDFEQSVGGHREAYDGATKAQEVTL